MALTSQPLAIFRGDNRTFNLTLSNYSTGAVFNPTGYTLIFSVKTRTSDADTSALIQKEIGAGITVTNAATGQISVDLVPIDTAALQPHRPLVWDVQATLIATGAITTVAVGALRIGEDVTNGTVPVVPIYTTYPGSPLGAQAYAAVVAHLADLANPHAVTKTQVGLSNADNTSDANKPVSTLQAAADAAAQAAAIAASQPVNAKLTSIAALASAAGWLHNDGAGAFAYSTPTAANVGAVPAWAGLTTNGLLQATAASTVASTLTPAGLTSLGVNGITSAALSNLTLGTGTFGTALTIASATGIPTFGANPVISVAAGPQLTLTRPSAAVGGYVRYMTTTTDDWVVGSGASGTNSDYEIYSYGTSAVALKLARATGAATFGAGITGTTSVFSTTGGTPVTVSQGTIGQNWLSFKEGGTEKWVFYPRVTGELSLYGPAGADVLRITSVGLTVSGSILGSGASAPTSTTTGSNVFTAGIATSGPVYAGGIGSFAGLINSGTFATAGEGNVNSSISGSGILLGNTNTLTNAVVAATSNRDVIIAHWNGSTYVENARFALGLTTTLAGNLTVSGTTDSTTPTTGSGIFSGGLGVAKNIGQGDGFGINWGVAQTTLISGNSATSTLILRTGGTNRVTVTDATTTLQNNLTISGTGTSSVAGTFNVGTGQLDSETVNIAGAGDSVGLSLYSSGTGGKRFFIVSSGGSSGYGQGNLVFGNETVGRFLSINYAAGVSTFHSTTSGTSTTAASILGKSLGLTENLWVGGTGNFANDVTISRAANTLLFVQESDATHTATVRVGYNNNLCGDFYQNTNGHVVIANNYNDVTSYIDFIVHASSSPITALSLTNVGNAVFASTTASTAYNAASVTLAGGLGVAKEIIGNIVGNALGGIATSASTVLALAAGTTAASSLRIPHGAAPTSPVNGDIWTTTAGLFVRINGATVGPLT